jgi:two-component system cell cycle response regulator DivK
MKRRHRRQLPTRPSVLLADAHADTRELYALALKPFGFETIVVGEGARAYAEARQMHPDIIVTELWFPHFDGWSFIREIKHDPRTRDIPIVVVTSDGHAHARQRADLEGCSAFVVKPCLPEDLATTLRAALNETRVHDASER